MLRKGATSGGQTGGQQQGEGRNLEVGVAEMSNSICNAMMGLVLTDQSLRSRQRLSQMRRKKHNYTEASYPLLFYLI